MGLDIEIQVQTVESPTILKRKFLNASLSQPTDSKRQILNTIFSQSTFSQHDGFSNRQNLNRHYHNNVLKRHFTKRQFLNFFK